MHEVDRTRRISEMVRRELSTLIQRELSDPRITNITVNSVKVSRDLRTADVYISRMNDLSLTGEQQKSGKSDQKTQPGHSEQQKEIIELLTKAGGYLRHMLSQNVDLRVTPELRFKYDNSIQHGMEISALIDSLVNKNGSE